MSNLHTGDLVALKDGRTGYVSRQLTAEGKPTRKGVVAFVDLTLQIENWGDELFVTVPRDEVAELIG